MALEKELATYNANLPELKAQAGKYVLIHGEDVIDTYPHGVTPCRTSRCKFLRAGRSLTPSSASALRAAQL